MRNRTDASGLAEWDRAADHAGERVDTHYESRVPSDWSEPFLLEQVLREGTFRFSKTEIDCLIDDL